MKRRRRVLAESLIILASALVVLVLISSSPAEASGGTPGNPPVGSDPSNPIAGQGTGATLPSDQPSENSQSDPTPSQQAEQTEEPNDNLIDNTPPSLPDQTQAKPQPTKQQPKPAPEDESNAGSQLPSDGSAMDATANSGTIADNSLDGLDVKVEVVTADHEPADEETQSMQEDLESKLRWDYESEDESEAVLEDDTRSEMLDAIEEEPVMGPMAISDDAPVVKKLEVREEPKGESSSSEKKEREKGLTTSSGIEVVEIKVSSHIDKIVEEPITKFLFGMYTRLDNAEDLRGVRKKIYQYIKAHPGEHMATLMKEFKLSPSSISHHINVLEKNGFIISHNDGRYKRLFVNGNGFISTVSSNYKSQISALKNENAKKIIFFLMARPASTQYELSNALDLHPSTIHWHARKLMSLDLISAIRDGKNIRYTVNDSTCVIKVLSVVETVHVLSFD